MNTNKPMELSYYGLSLLQFLVDSHPEKVDDIEFVETRANIAADAYEKALLDGYVAPQAEEIASEALYNGLHFSKHDTIVQILWNEFEDEILQGDAKGVAIRLLPHLEEVFLKYPLSDDYAYTTDYQMLYTELTGTILIYMEEYGI